MTEKGDGLVAAEQGADGGAEGHAGNRTAAELNGDLPFQDSDELRTLISQGQERGYLTFEEIAGTLEEVEVTGLQSTLPFHRWLMADDDFRAGALATDFVERRWDPGPSRKAAAERAARAAAQASWIALEGAPPNVGPGDRSPAVGSGRSVDGRTGGDRSGWSRVAVASQGNLTATRKPPSSSASARQVPP